jgi:hypothetical protein
VDHLPSVHAENPALLVQHGGIVGRRLEERRKRAGLVKLCEAAGGGLDLQLVVHVGRGADAHVEQR